MNMFTLRMQRLNKTSKTVLNIILINEAVIMQNDIEKYEYLKPHPFSVLTLGLTKGCNLRCTYCYESIYGYDAKQIMTWETAKKAIDLFWSQLTKYHIISAIYFFGGEPHMNFDLIKKVVDYSYGHKTMSGYMGRYPNYLLSTNGTILSFEMYKLYSKLGSRINIRISVDGFGEDHDINRKTINGKGSWPLLKKNLKYYRILSEKYGVKISLNCTINKSNIKNLYDNYTKLFELTNMCIGHFWVLEENWTREDFDIIKEQISMLYDYCARNKSWVFNVCNPNPQMELYNVKTTGETEHECICPSGTKAMSVDNNGNILPCIKCLYNFPEEIAKFGNVDTGIDENKRKKFLYEVNNLDNLLGDCKNCDSNIRYRCNVCLCNNNKANGSPHKIHEKMCAFQKELHAMLIEKGKQL